jgi:hypothetical protein
MGTHWLNVEIELQGSNAPEIAVLLAPRERPKDRSARKGASGKGEAESEDLPYHVELWNAEKTAVEQVVAVTASASIGQAAFYAAAREYAERYVTLRHKQAVINRWNGPSH